jgi:hypothetical protein
LSLCSPGGASENNFENNCSGCDRLWQRYLVAIENFAKTKEMLLNRINLEQFHPGLIALILLSKDYLAPQKK